MMKFIKIGFFVGIFSTSLFEFRIYGYGDSKKPDEITVLTQELNQAKAMVAYWKSLYEYQKSQTQKFSAIVQSMDQLYLAPIGEDARIRRVELEKTCEVSGSVLKGGPTNPNEGELRCEKKPVETGSKGGSKEGSK